MVSVLIGALLLGVVAGLRSLTAPAALFLARGGIAGYVLVGLLYLVALGSGILGSARRVDAWFANSSPRVSCSEH